MVEQHIELHLQGHKCQPLRTFRLLKACGFSIAAPVNQVLFDLYISSNYHRRNLIAFIIEVTSLQPSDVPPVLCNRHTGRDCVNPHIALASSYVCHYNNSRPLWLLRKSGINRTYLGLHVCSAYHFAPLNSRQNRHIWNGSLPLSSLQGQQHGRRGGRPGLACA